MTHFPTALRHGKTNVFVVDETSHVMCLVHGRRSRKMRHTRHLAGIHAPSSPLGEKERHHDTYTQLRLPDRSREGTDPRPLGQFAAINQGSRT